MWGNMTIALDLPHHKIEIPENPPEKIYNQTELEIEIENVMIDQMKKRNFGPMFIVWLLDNEYHHIKHGCAGAYYQNFYDFCLEKSHADCLLFTWEDVNTFFNRYENVLSDQEKLRRVASFIIKRYAAIIQTADYFGIDKANLLINKVVENASQ